MGAQEIEEVGRVHSTLSRCDETLAEHAQDLRELRWSGREEGRDGAFVRKKSGAVGVHLGLTLSGVISVSLASPPVSQPQCTASHARLGDIAPLLRSAAEAV